MSLLTAWATRYLERRRYVVLEDSFLAGEDAFANVGPFTLLRRDGRFKVVSADARVVQIGEIVVSPAAMPGMPRPGVYKPALASIRSRTVRRSVGAFVFYDNGKSCKLPSWERWVRKTRAVCR